MWERFLPNPSVRLGSGSIPRVPLSTMKMPNLIGTSWQRKLKPLNNGVIAAAVYRGANVAERNKIKFTKEVKKLGLAENQETKVFRDKSTLILVKADVEPKKINTHSKTGSPYFREDKEQVRSADEAPQIRQTDLVSGKVTILKGNPPKKPDAIVTVPHAVDDGIENGHSCDWTAEIAGRQLAHYLSELGVHTCLLIGEEPRTSIDLNRIESEGTPFHFELNELIPSCSVLYDIHSYPENHPIWGEYDAVLFGFGPFQTDNNNKDIVDLARSIEQITGANVLVDIATEKENYIQNKSNIFGKEGHLIEFNEASKNLGIEEAIAMHSIGVVENPPTKLPPGGSFRQFTIALPVSLPETRAITAPELLLIELEERGFSERKRGYDTATGTLVEYIQVNLPDGMPTKPYIHFQRKQKSARVYQAQYLNNDELWAIHKLFLEACETQPMMNPEPSELDELGVVEDKREAFNKWVEKENKKAVQGYLKKLGKMDEEEIEKWIEENMGAKITDKSSDDDIIEAIKKINKEPPMKNDKLNRSKALQQFFDIVNKDSSTADIKAQLKKQNISEDSVKVEGKFDRKKALEALKSGETTKRVQIKKPSRLNLSTNVTKSIMRALIPGAGDIVKEGKEKKGGKKEDKKGDKGDKKEKDDWSKEFRIVDGNKISKKDWVAGRPPREITNWDEWNNAPIANPQPINNPTAYAQQYIDDHEVMTPSEEKKKFKKMKLAGPIGSKKFFEQIYEGIQNFGEGQGWVRDGYLFWRAGPGRENFVNVDGHMLEGAAAWMHTHPAAWEPSQTSPDDFKVMHGLHTNFGIRHCFTIIADRIDWFEFPKKQQSMKHMIEIVEDFEKEIVEGFAFAEQEFQDLKGDEPYMTHEQTRYINNWFNKNIPEYRAKYRAYLLSPKQIASK
jgi:hypothetical protein